MYISVKPLTAVLQPINAHVHAYACSTYVYFDISQYTITIGMVMFDCKLIVIVLMPFSCILVVLELDLKPYLTQTLR